MAVARITKRSVDAVAKPQKGRVFLWDDMITGFGLMVTANAARSYIFQYRIGGRGSPTRRATIGQHGDPWTAEGARERAIELRGLVRRKIDPIDADKARLAAIRESKDAASRYAFDIVADAFVKSREAGKLRSAADVKAIFRRDLKPFFGIKSLPTITRADVHDCLAGLGERSESAANKAHSWLRAMFAWAVDQGRYGIMASPMSSMSPPFGTVKRKRILSDAELRLVWYGATSLGDPFGALAKLLLLTGQRLREVANMKWDEVEIVNATWRVPGERTKNKQDHLCPLSPSAIAVLEAIQPDKNLRKGFVLTTNTTAAVSGFSRAKLRLNKAIADAQAERAKALGIDAMLIKPWTFHDLRRTLATGLQALGFSVEVNEAVINHVSGKRGGIVGVYQLHDYWNERVTALVAWARHVEGLISDERGGSNVIALDDRRIAFRNDQ